MIFTRRDKGHDDPALTAEAVGGLREREQRAASRWRGGVDRPIRQAT